MFTTTETPQAILERVDETTVRKTHREIVRYRSWRRRIRDALIDLSNPLGFRHPDRSDMAEYEARILSAWNAAGIPSPAVKNVLGSSIDLEYIPGMAFDVIIKQPKQSALISLMLVTFQSIRGLARDRADPTLLHPDPTPYNMLYHDGKAYALDPALRLQPWTLDRLDASLSLYFVTRLHAHGLEQYAEQAAASFSDDDRASMIEAQRFYSPLALAVLRFNEFRAGESDEKRLTTKFGPNRQKRIREILQS